MGNSKNYTTLVTRLREVAAGEAIGRRQLLLSAAGAVEALQRELTDEQTLLAIAAGAHAIEINKRLFGATFAFDIKGKFGGPKMITYHAAAQRLAELTDPLLEGGKDG